MDDSGGRSGTSSTFYTSSFYKALSFYALTISLPSRIRFLLMGPFLRRPPEESVSTSAGRLVPRPGGYCVLPHVVPYKACIALNGGRLLRLSRAMPR